MCWCLCVYVMIKCIEGVLCIQWQFQSCQVTRAGNMTHTVKPLCHSWISTQSNKHNWPEFYPGNAWTCPCLEPPMYTSLSATLQLLYNCEKGTKLQYFVVYMISITPTHIIMYMGVDVLVFMCLCSDEVHWGSIMYKLPQCNFITTEQL